MESVNPTDQYRKLEELYTEMSDSRLQEMAGQIDDLTDIAQEVLRAEISRRRLDKATAEIPINRPVALGDDLVRVWGAKDQSEAESVADVLVSAGIPAIPGTEKFELVDGGFEEQPVVRVVPESRLRALELLGQYFPQAPEPEEDETVVAVCPNCKSPEIIFESLDSQQGEKDAVKFNWSCDACGHQWRDDGLEQLA